MTKKEFNNKMKKLDRIGKSIVVFYLTILVLVFTFVFTGKSQTDNRTYVYYTVKEHDRLWNISKEHLGSYSMDIREYVYEIKQLNKITDEIYPGDILEIPLYSNSH